MVHRLVAMCFLDCPKNFEELQVNHIDANKANNHFSNLEWVTKQENMDHGKKLKLFKPGMPRKDERNKEMARLYKEKVSVAKIAEKYGISKPRARFVIYAYLEQ